MYFPILPLLLLFASAICASPIHIGRRMNNLNGPTTLLPHKYEDMDLYKKWDQYLRNSEEEKIHGVEVAVKVDIGLQYIIVKVEVTHEDAGHVENMIDKLGHQVLINWVWYKRPHRVAFLIRMKPDGEEEVKEYLGKLRRPRA